MSSVNSSTTPETSACRTVEAPPRDVYAVVAGRLTRLCVGASKPSVTKWKVVTPSISIGSRA